MYRFDLDKLNSWFSGKYRMPMVIWGARQVGKTYLLCDLFAEDVSAGRTLEEFTGQ